MAEPAADAIRRSRVAANRGRQRELYGAPLGDRVRRLTATLGISQARLARAVGLSPPMLSQLVSAHRVKIGDPAVLARILLLDQRCRAMAARPAPVAVDALLAEVSRAGWRWAGWERPAEGDPTRAAPPPRPPDRRGRDGARTPADALRGVAEPARLTAAAAVLHPTFPELAELLRQAAGRPRPARAD